MYACPSCWRLSDDWLPRIHCPLVQSSCSLICRFSAGAQSQQEPQLELLVTHPSLLRLTASVTCCHSLVTVASLSSPTSLRSLVSLRNVKLIIQWAFARTGRVLSFKMTTWDQNWKQNQTWQSNWDFEQMWVSNLSSKQNSDPGLHQLV